MVDLSGAIARYGPAVFFTGIALFYTVRILTLRARLGYSPVSYGDAGSRHLRHSRTFRWFRLAIWLVAVALAVDPGLLRYLGPLPPLLRPGVMVAGNLIMALAFAFVAAVNLGQGAFWRSGVAADGQAVPPLLTDGPYRYARHPMFAAVMLGQAGLFLAIPSLFTLVCLVVGIATLRGQALIEEENLARRHGELWRRYAAATPRWPWSRLGLGCFCHQSVT